MSHQRIAEREHGQTGTTRTTGENIEAPLEMFRSSYLQVDKFLSHIYENRAMSQEDEREGQKEDERTERVFL